MAHVTQEYCSKHFIFTHIHATCQCKWAIEWCASNHSLWSDAMEEMQVLFAQYLGPLRKTEPLMSQQDPSNSLVYLGWINNAVLIQV